MIGKTYNNNIKTFPTFADRIISKLGWSRQRLRFRINCGFSNTQMCSRTSFQLVPSCWIHFESDMWNLPTMKPSVHRELVIKMMVMMLARKWVGSRLSHCMLIVGFYCCRREMERKVKSSDLAGRYWGLTTRLLRVLPKEDHGGWGGPSAAIFSWWFWVSCFIDGWIVLFCMGWFWIKFFMVWTLFYALL